MLTINQDAALFLLAQIAKNPNCPQQPLRLKQKQKGCGDIGHEFTHAQFVMESDTQSEAFGLTVVCNFQEFPDFEDATIALVPHPQGSFARQKIVVIPEGAHLCGCGESAALPGK